MKALRKDYRQISNDVLTQISGGKISEEIEYTEAKSLYELSSKPVEEILEVRGGAGGAETVFREDEDYRLTGNAIEWISGGRRPDDGTAFRLTYRFSRAAGITDMSAGSVVRTIVEALSREIDHLYSQMEEVYRSGFLDTAEGEALDMVVSLLGISRKPPRPSSGIVTFGRTSEPETISTTEEVHLYDGSDEYELKKPLVDQVEKVEGTVDGSPQTFEEGSDFIVADDSIHWLPEGRTPDQKTVFRVDYTSFQEIEVPKGSSVSTFSTTPEDARTFTAVEAKALAPAQEERWEADVPVVCDEPGAWGNVLAGTITVMPQPVPGIEYVINKGDITNGVETETDAELRERAKHALEFAGRATVSSLESALGSIEGVRSLLVEDMPDDVPGIVRVIVDGGDPERISEVIDNTRAAGIKVEFARPTTAYIDVSFLLTISVDRDPVTAMSEAEAAVRSYISSLGIGDDVLYSRILDAALRVPDAIDVTRVKVVAHKESEVMESEKENIPITNQERAEPRNMEIDFDTRD